MGKARKAYSVLGAVPGPKKQDSDRKGQDLCSYSPTVFPGSSPPLLPGQCGSVTPVWTSAAWHPAPASFPPHPPGHQASTYLSPGSLVLGTGSLAGIPDTFPPRKENRRCVRFACQFGREMRLPGSWNSKSGRQGPLVGPSSVKLPHSFSEFQHPPSTQAEARAGARDVC